MASTGGLPAVVLAGLVALCRSGVDVAMPEIVCSVHIPRDRTHGQKKATESHQCDLNCLPARFGLDFAAAAATAAADDDTASGRSIDHVVPIVLATRMHGCDSPPPSESGDTNSATRGAYRGALVLAFRGDCSFAAKASAARDGGAVGLVVANYDTRSNAAAAATRALAAVNTLDEAASAAATAQAASTEAVISEEQPFFMVANPGEDSGLRNFPVLSVGGMEGRWLRAAVLLSANSRSVDGPRQPGSGAVRMSWRMLPKFSAVDRGGGDASGTNKRSATGKTAQAGAQPLSVETLVTALVASRRGADVVRGSATTHNIASTPLGRHMDEYKHGSAVYNEGGSGVVSKRTPGGDGMNDGAFEDADDDVIEGHGDGSLQLATQFAKMDDPQRAIKELLRVARVSAGRAKAAAKMIAPGGNSRSMSAPSYSIAYREMRDANAQEAKALLLLAWLQQDICEWDRPVHGGQHWRRQQVAKYRKQALGLPSVLQRLVSLVVEWGWGGAGASELGAESEQAKGKGRGGRTRGSTVNDEEDSTGGDDEEDSTGGDDGEHDTDGEGTTGSTDNEEVAAPEARSLTALGRLLLRLGTLPSKIFHLLLGIHQSSSGEPRHQATRRLSSSQSQRVERERIIAAVGAVVANEANVAASADSAALASLCNQLQPSLASDGDGADFTFGGTNFGAGLAATRMLLRTCSSASAAILRGAMSCTMQTWPQERFLSIAAPTMDCDVESHMLHPGRVASLKAEAQFAARFKQLRLVKHRPRAYWSGFPGLTGITALLRWFVTLGFLRGTPPPQRRRVRVGYISSGFVPSHPLFGLVQRLFSMHDRDRFDVWCYAIGHGALYRDQGLTWNGANNHGRIPCAHVRNFVYDNTTAASPHGASSSNGDTTPLSAFALASQLMIDDIDVVVDLDAYTRGGGKRGAVPLGHETSANSKASATTSPGPAGFDASSMMYAAYLPGRIRLHWLGQPSRAVGAAFMDYFVSDRTLIPPEAEAAMRAEPLEAARVVTAAAATADAAAAAAVRRALVVDTSGDASAATAWGTYGSLPAVRAAVAARRAAAAAEAAARAVRSMERLLMLPCSYYIGDAHGEDEKSSVAAQQPWPLSPSANETNATRAGEQQEPCKTCAKTNGNAFTSNSTTIGQPICGSRQQCGWVPLSWTKAHDQSVVWPLEHWLTCLRSSRDALVDGAGQRSSDLRPAQRCSVYTHCEHRVWAPFHGTRLGMTPVGLSAYLAALSQKRDAAARLTRLSAVDVISQMEGVAQRASHGLPARRAQLLHSRNTRGRIFADVDEDDDATGAGDTEASADDQTLAAPAVRSSVRGFVFACFAKAKKICPQVMEVWMRLLHRVPGSVLWITSAAGSGASARAARRRLRETAAAAGVRVERLVFGRYLSSRAAHLRRLSLADLALDTLAFNAGSGAVDTLRAGVPLLSLAAGPPLHLSGQTSDSLREQSGAPPIPASGVPATAVAARMGASVLRAALGGSIRGAGRAHLLLAHSLREYEDIASRLATTVVLRKRERMTARSVPSWEPPRRVLPLLHALQLAVNASRTMPFKAEPCSPFDLRQRTAELQRAYLVSLEVEAMHRQPELRAGGGGAAQVMAELRSRKRFHIVVGK